MLNLDHVHVCCGPGIVLFVVMALIIASSVWELYQLKNGLSREPFFAWAAHVGSKNTALITAFILSIPGLFVLRFIGGRDLVMMVAVRDWVIVLGMVACCVGERDGFMKCMNFVYISMNLSIDQSIYVVVYAVKTTVTVCKACLDFGFSPLCSILQALSWCI